MRKLLSFFRMVNLIGFVQQVSSMSMEAGLVGKIILSIFIKCRIGFLKL